MTENGWTYDPAEQAWTAKVGPHRWLIVKGDLDDAPTWRPEDVADEPPDAWDRFAATVEAVRQSGGYDLN